MIKAGLIDPSLRIYIYRYETSSIADPTYNDHMLHTSLSKYVRDYIAVLHMGTY